LANVENANLLKENKRLQGLMSDGEKRGDKIKAVTKQVHAFKEQIDAAQYESTHPTNTVIGQSLANY